MIAFLRSSLARSILNPNSNNVCKSPFCFSLYLKLLSTSSESGIDPKLSNILVHQHNFDPDFVTRVASKLADVKNPKNAGLVLSFLRESGFPLSRLERIVSYRPRLLSVSLEDSIRPKIIHFQKMGLSSDDISRMISTHPKILCLSLNANIVPSLALLKQLFGSDDEVLRVVRMNPRFLPANLAKNVLPNFEFFESCGVPVSRIRTVLLSSPRGFLLKPEVMRRSAEMAREMGVDESSVNFIYAAATIASMSYEAWKLKLQDIRSLGFSESDMASMFRKAPQAFGVSAEKMKKIVELVLDTKKYSMSSIVDYPKSLQFSIEKRYKPRLQMLGILESRSLIKEWPPLSVVVKLSDDVFFKRFVSPYADKVSDVCSIENSAMGGRRWNF